MRLWKENRPLLRSHRWEAGSSDRPGVACREGPGPGAMAGIAPAALPQVRTRVLVPRGEAGASPRTRRDLSARPLAGQDHLCPAGEEEPLVAPLDALHATRRVDLDVARGAAERRCRDGRGARARAGRLASDPRRAPRSGSPPGLERRPARTRRWCPPGTPRGARARRPSRRIRASSSVSSSRTHCGLPTRSVATRSGSPSTSMVCSRTSVGRPMAARKTMRPARRSMNARRLLAGVGVDDHRVVVARLDAMDLEQHGAQAANAVARHLGVAAVSVEQAHRRARAGVRCRG